MSLTGFQRRRRELAKLKQAKVATKPQVDTIEQPQEDKLKRRKKGDKDASG